MFLMAVHISVWSASMFGTYWRFQYIFENQMKGKIVSQSQNTN